MKNNEFYKSFEDRFRGTPSEITERLKFYLPFVSEINPSANQPCIDLGCGRGEWLQLLRSHNVCAIGFDTDVSMVQCCKSAGLDVREGDILGALRQFESASIPLVSAFHVAEHLPFEYLTQLIAECLRVLKPNGLLILETPNPENFSMGAGKFYLDPTHDRPLHPLLLSFLVTYAGFERQVVAGLQEWPHLQRAEQVGIYDVLWGSSADYAVIALKSAAQATQTLNDLFARSYGLSAETLAKRFDQQLQSLQQGLLDANHQILRRVELLENIPGARLGMTLARLKLALKKRLGR